jgi:hypothetical protein
VWLDALARALTLRDPRLPFVEVLANEQLMGFTKYYATILEHAKPAIGGAVWQRVLLVVLVLETGCWACLDLIAFAAPIITPQTYIPPKKTNNNPQPCCACSARPARRPPWSTAPTARTAPASWSCSRWRRAA